MTSVRSSVDGPAGWVVLDRPEQYNVITVELGRELEGALTGLGARPDVNADIVLIRDDARVSDNHIRFGQVPGGGSTQRLPRLLGRQQALGLLLSGERVDGRAAVQLGLAFRSWPADAFEDEVAAFVDTLAARRRDAVTRIKRLVYDGLETSLTAGLAAELDAVIEHIAGEAGGAGVTAFSTRSS